MSSNVPRRVLGSGWDRAGDDGCIAMGPAPDGDGRERTGPEKATVEKAAIVLLEVMAPT
jgi:hypothetical protein